MEMENRHFFEGLEETGACNRTYGLTEQISMALGRCVRDCGFAKAHETVHHKK